MKGMFLIKEHLKSPNRFKELKGLMNFAFDLKREYKLPFDEEDISMLLLSVLRCDDISGSYGILQKEGKRMYIDELGVRKRLGSETSYIDSIRNRVFSGLQCGQIRTNFVCYVCGYFEVSDENLRKEGKTLEYLGEVKEERHLVRIDELKYTRSDWKEFLKSVGLC